MEGNLGNIALHPGLVPAECRLTNCFCLGKENKPYLGAETFGEVQSCQSHLRRAHIASPYQPVKTATQHICQRLTRHLLLIKFYQRERVVRNLMNNLSHVLPYRTPNITSD